MATVKETPKALSQVLSTKSKWNAEKIENFLHGSQLPLRISSISSEGYPHISSLWFHFDNHRFLSCTQQQSVVCKQILNNSRVGFEVAVNQPPYCGVSGKGTARVISEGVATLLDNLTDHYLEGRDPKLKSWLMSRLDTEVIIEITPISLTSWDFKRRMSEAD